MTRKRQLASLRTQTTSQARIVLPAPSTHALTPPAAASWAGHLSVVGTVSPPEPERDPWKVEQRQAQGCPISQYYIFLSGTPTAAL